MVTAANVELHCPANPPLVRYRLEDALGDDGNMGSGLVLTHRCSTLLQLPGGVMYLRLEGACRALALAGRGGRRGDK